MTLTPTARALIDSLVADGPAVETLTPEEARRASEERRARAAPAVEPIHSVEDSAFGGPGGEIGIRVYRPSDDAPLPAVVFFHGGGWVLCDLDSHDPICRRISKETGSIVVSVDYRRAPEHRFPAAVEDSYAAVAHLVDHAGELGIDPVRVAVAGDSAGGNLAAAAALMARDRGGPELAFQLLVYPITDHDFDTPSYRANSDGYYVTRAAMQWYWKQYLGHDGDADSPYASPLRCADLEGLPPALIITAEHDPLRDEGRRYAERLRDAGVAAALRDYPGMFHGFFTLGSMLPEARAANREAFEALVRAFASATTNQGDQIR